VALPGVRLRAGRVRDERVVHSVVHRRGHSEVKGRAKEPQRLLLNLVVGDVATEEARLRSHGVEFVRDASVEDEVGVFATFVDPDGNYCQLVELYGYPPATAPGRRIRPSPGVSSRRRSQPSTIGTPQRRRGRPTSLGEQGCRAPTASPRSRRARRTEWRFRGRMVCGGPSFSPRSGTRRRPAGRCGWSNSETSVNVRPLRPWGGRR